MLQTDSYFIELSSLTLKMDGRLTDVSIYTPSIDVLD